MKNENINEILSAREEKHQQIFNLLNDYKTVVVLSINYPGPNKCNKYSKEVFISAIDKIKKEFLVEKIIQKESYAGYYAIIPLNENSRTLKLKAIQIEDEWVYGRLIDLDVYDQQVGLLSRNSFHKENRKCFICNLDAKICGRNRTHTVDELINFFENYVNKNRERENGK